MTRHQMQEQIKKIRQMGIETPALTSKDIDLEAFLDSFNRRLQRERSQRESN
jgi:hypothetical protein